MTSTGVWPHCPAEPEGRDGIRDGVEGLLHRPGDPDDLAARIVAMLTDPDGAAELGRQAAARCDRDFHPVAIAERMVAHFRRTKARAAAHDRAG